MTFGERLKELRENAGMTQAAIWEATGLPRKTYLNYEQGHVAAVPFPAVLAISKALGVDCSAFAECDYSPLPETEVEPDEAPTPKPVPMGKYK